MKNTIIFKGFYLGEDKPNIKKGAPIRIEFVKQDLLMHYQNYDLNMRLTKQPQISLLSYVREKVYGICLRGSLYN
jgi:hypothetical protein